jgi:hypothetical protein
MHDEREGVPAARDAPATIPEPFFGIDAEPIASAADRARASPLDGGRAFEACAKGHGRRQKIGVAGRAQ